MKNEFKALSDTYEYAIGHGMNPLDSTTWTEDYRRKLKRLLDSMRAIDDEFNRFKKIIDENREYLHQ